MGMSLPTVGQVFLNQLSIKKMPYRQSQSGGGSSSFEVPFPMWLRMKSSWYLKLTLIVRIENRSFKTESKPTPMPFIYQVLCVDSTHGKLDRELVLLIQFCWEEISGFIYGQGTGKWYRGFGARKPGSSCVLWKAPPCCQSAEWTFVSSCSCGPCLFSGQ